jgi:hypothetical protein
MLLHLSIDNGRRTLCDRPITAAFIEPSYTQRTKCRACWLRRAEQVVHYHVGHQQAVPGTDCEECR